MVRLSRRFSSFAFSLRRLYRGALRAKPSPLLLAFLAIGGAVFLMGGGVYDILEKPLGILPGLQGRWIFYWPYDINEQSLNESIIVIIYYALGALGFLLAYQSTRYAYRPRQAWWLLVLGATFIIISFWFGLEHLISLKLAR